MRIFRRKTAFLVLSASLGAACETREAATKAPAASATTGYGYG